MTRTMLYIDGDDAPVAPVSQGTQAGYVEQLAERMNSIHNTTVALGTGKPEELHEAVNEFAATSTWVPGEFDRETATARANERRVKEETAQSESSEQGGEVVANGTA